jgi:NADH dehydrogenase
VPSLNRKIRVLVDWTLALVLRREVVSMGGLHAPRAPFIEATPPAAGRSEFGDESRAATGFKA